MLACEEPKASSKPRWVTSSLTQITIVWDGSTDDGGCPITAYRVFRDKGLGLGAADVIYEVHSDQLLDKTHITQLSVTDLPSDSVGNRFVFAVEV